jgi:hypothetical protein
MSDEVEAFLSSLPEEVERIARALRGRIRELVPEAVEKRHGGWKILEYSRDGSMKTSICAIAPHSKHVNLQLFHGAGLEDPLGLLEGTGKTARHVKLRSVEDVARPGVGRLIERAAEAAGDR